MLACAPLTSMLCFISPYPTHASGSLLILQLVSDRGLASRHVVLVVCPCCPHVCCSLPMLACGPLTCLLCFPLPYPTPASGSLLFLQRVSDRLAARHVVLVMCPRCPDVCCWLAMLACAPLTCLLCFLLPYPTHASGSLLFLQLVNDWLAARHVVLVVCPLLFHVCCWPALLACGPLTCLLCFVSPCPTHASGSLLFLQGVSDRLAARHVVLVVCPRCPDVCCCLAILACAPLTCLLCFLLPYPTHASGSLLFLQLVNDWLAARHVVLVVCSRCPDA